MEAQVAVPRGRAEVAGMLRGAPDERLVERMRTGCHPAFEELYARHRGPLLAYCRRILGSPHEAEDAVQQTFLAAYRELGRLEPCPPVRAWLFGVARHRCLAALRTRRACPPAVVQEHGAESLEPSVALREDLRALLDDVAELPHDQRSALVLTELGDRSHAEIAPLLGCPPRKVEALVFQARASLTAGRAARETPCAEIRALLRDARGAARRKSVLRRHLRGCADCRAFAETLPSRRRIRAVLPLGALLTVKRIVLGAVAGPGAPDGAALVTGSAGLALTAVLAGRRAPGCAARSGRPARRAGRAGGRRRRAHAGRAAAATGRRARRRAPRGGGASRAGAPQRRPASTA